MREGCYPQLGMLSITLLVGVIAKGVVAKGVIEMGVTANLGRFISTIDIEKGVIEIGVNEKGFGVCEKVVIHRDAIHNIVGGCYREGCCSEGCYGDGCDRESRVFSIFRQYG